jgi:hypothetical protein
MDRTGSGGGAPAEWSPDDIKRYLTLQRFLPKNSGLFGSGWAQFLADRADARTGISPTSPLLDAGREQGELLPQITPVAPLAPVALPPLSRPPLGVAAAAEAGRNSIVALDPVGLGFRASPSFSFVAGAVPPRGPVNNLSRMSAPLSTRPAMQAAAQANRAPPIDPSTTDVFQRGPDGKLHPIPDWRTTGPFDVGTWAHNIDWGGALSDLGNIGSWAATILSGGEALAAPGALKALGLDGILESGVKGAIHAHHVDPRFMGGRAEQETYDLIAKFHQKFHGNLQRALKEAGFPPVGSKAGSREVWAEFFDKYAGARDKAVEILRQVSRDFDIEHGTSILPSLEKELQIAKPTPKIPPPRN